MPQNRTHPNDSKYSFPQLGVSMRNIPQIHFLGPLLENGLHLGRCANGLFCVFLNFVNFVNVWIFSSITFLRELFPSTWNCGKMTKKHKDKKAQTFLSSRGNGYQNGEFFIAKESRNQIANRKKTQRKRTIFGLRIFYVDSNLLLILRRVDSFGCRTGGLHALPNMICWRVAWRGEVPPAFF